ncbi:hypothetical protein KXD40_002824 [Peronospora effusa]|uniref:Uncharacterized protein n=1 Tax=Peronospora effusa TaxID=542832 RepID=A0A3M6VQZ0_9STRA|nr:hypothetical protein DD238_003938 [Peronospora effusa]RQM09466.1 hypothetical protein DD237_003561 [Peronospora effusa]UIZ29530.1 hypothetical protein KXD40_002824 [Peronospora effusa]
MYTNLCGLSARKEEMKLPESWDAVKQVMNASSNPREVPLYSTQNSTREKSIESEMVGGIASNLRTAP